MSLLLDLKQGARSLARTPGYVVTAVLSLAVGIGAGVAGFGVLDAVRFRALPFPHADRLVLLSEISADPTASCAAACDVSYETYARLLATHPFQSLEAVAAYTSGLKVLNRGGDPIPVLGGVVSPNLFGLLDVQPALGRAIEPGDNRLDVPPVVVLSHELWTNHLGADPRIVGTTLKLSDTHYTVIGVMPPGFEHEVGTEFWLPVVPTLDPSTRPSIRSVVVVGRLAPGRTLAQARAELATIDPLALRGDAAPGAAPLRLEAAPLRLRYTSSTRSHDLAFAIVVGSVLLIAVANLASLSLVRALHRQRDFAIRTALGADLGRVVRALLAQHGLVVLLATMVGLGLAAWLLGVLDSLDALQSIRPPGMEYRLDGRAVGFAVALGALEAVVLSLVPARLVARADVERLLREGGPAATRGAGSLAQRVFVVGQVAFAVALVTSAGLMLKTVARLGALDLGFEPAGLVQGSPSLPHPWRVPERYLPVARQLLAELGALPGVRRVALRAEVPLAPRGQVATVTRSGDAAPLPAALVPAEALSVSPGYAATMGIRILRGREFDERDTGRAPAVALLNEWAAARWWPGLDPVGRTFRVDTTLVTVVGVVATNRAARPGLLIGDDGPEIYRPYEQHHSAFPVFFLDGGAAAATLLRPARDVLVRLVPDRPASTTRVADMVAGQLAGVRRTALQILGFAAVGLGLALVGVYGLLAYTVGRRAPELGIRGALGASRGRLGALVLRDALGLALLGAAIGFPLAAAAGRAFGDLLAGTSPVDPPVYLAVAAVLAGVVALASWIPARRAANVAPLEALRTD